MLFSAALHMTVNSVHIGFLINALRQEFLNPALLKIQLQFCRNIRSRERKCFCCCLTELLGTNIRGKILQLCPLPLLIALFLIPYYASFSPRSSPHSTYSSNRFRLLQRTGESALHTATATKLLIKSMFNSHRSRPLTEKVEAFHLQRDTWRLLARKESRRISAIVTSCPIYFTERVLSLTLRRSEGPRNETRPIHPMNCWSVCGQGAKCTF